MVYLLDINVLLALFDSNHVAHDIAHRWFGDVGRRSWATCPITQNGVVRVASHPRYPGSPGTARDIASMLAELCAVKSHTFWPDDVTLMDRTVFDIHAGVTASQLTDIYLLGLSVRNKGRLATLDRRIPAGAVHGGADGIELLAS